MKSSLRAIELLQKRLKNIDNSTPSKELEEISNAVSAISKLETTDDILEMSAAKLSELLDYSNDKIADLETYGSDKQSELLSAKNSELSAIVDSKQSGIEVIKDLSSSKQNYLNSIVDNFKLMNDIPGNSTICAEIPKKLDSYKFLKPGDMPLVFGVLSRYDDYYNGFSTELGTWYNSGADIMLGILAGCHTYTTQYTGFYLEPKLCFLQGANGNFNKKKSYIKYQYSTTIYKHPYAALGCIFVKNKTASNITSTINFGGTCYSSTGGSSMFVGVPDYANSVVTWTNVYSSASTSSDFSNSASITIPANTTVCVLFYTSSYYISTPTNGSSAYGYHVQFLQWRLNSVRSGFLVNGIEIDFDKTMKAWQCTGFSNTFDIFK